MVSDEDKRWLVAGLVLNKVLLPQVRCKVEQDVKAEYLNLVKSHRIDTQAPVGRLTRWKIKFLKYQNINGNDGHKLPSGKPDYKKFNYHVTSHLDFAKLYLQPFMAKVSKFDECDASAVLTLLESVPVFSPATHTTAATVKQNVRNEWAHCDFAKWKMPMFSNCFKGIDLLVQSLGLTNCSQVVKELKDWETEGVNRIAACPVDQSLLTMAQQIIASLKTEVELLKSNEYAKKVAQLTNLSDRLTAIGKKVDENQKKIAANSKEIAENTSAIAANKSMTAANTNEIATNARGVAAKKSMTAANANQIAANARGVAANEVMIAENFDEIEAMKGNIAVDGDHAVERANTEYCSSVVPETTLPPMAPHFTGHQKEIDDLTARMRCSPTRLFSIWGSRGLGKTSIAIAVGHRLQEQRIRACFISLRRVCTVEALIEKLLTFLGQTPHSTVKSENQALDSLCGCFRAISSDTVLILDSVDDLLLPRGDTKSNFLHSIQELLQACANLRIVCTSRETMSYASLTLDVCQFHIGTLEAEESVRLLHVLTRDLDLICKEQDSLKDLAKVCGHAPLGLKLMATMMSQDRVLPTNIISDLDTSNFLEVIDSEDCSNEFRMRKIFEFSFLRLSKDYQKMFVSLIVFPGSFDAEAAAAVLDTTKLSEVKKNLGVLVRKSFLEFEQDSYSGRYSIHTLLQAFGQLVGGESSEMKKCQEKSRIRHHFYFLQLLEELNTLFLTGQSSDALHRFNKDKDSFMFCILDASSCDQTYTEATEKLTNMDIFLDAILWVDTTLSNKLYDTYMQNCKENCGRNSVLYASILLSKAFGYLHRTNHYADQLLSEADDVLQELPSVPSPVKAKLFCYWGFRKLILSQIEEGIGFLEKGVPLLDRATENVVIHLIALRLLIDNYMKKASCIATEKTQQAQSLCQNHRYLKPIVITQHAGEGNEDNTGNQPFLAQIFYFLSQICKAMKSTAHVKGSLLLEIKSTDEKRVTVGDTLEMAQQYHVFGASLISIGCPNKALEVHEKALDIRLKLLGEYNEDTASSYHKIGITLYRLGEYSRALHCHNQALDIRQKVLGEDNKHTASSCSNIGATHYKLTDYSSALKFHRHALVIRLKVLGKDHEDSAWSYDSIGATCSKLGDCNSALDSHRHALDIRLKVLGEYTKDTAWSYNNLGNIQSKRGDHNSALHFYKDALDIRLKVFGKEHEDTAWSYNNLGGAYLKVRDYDGALDSHKHALDIRLKVLGEDNASTAWSYHNIGLTHYEFGDYRSAQDSHEQAFDIRLKLFGEDNIYTKSSYNYMRKARGRLGGLH